MAKEQREKSRGQLRCYDQRIYLNMWLLSNKVWRQRLGFSELGHIPPHIKRTQGIHDRHSPEDLHLSSLVSVALVREDF